MKTKQTGKQWEEISYFAAKHTQQRTTVLKVPGGCLYRIVVNFKCPDGEERMSMTTVFVPAVLKKIKERK